jgi:hypothetical protein
MLLVFGRPMRTGIVFPDFAPTHGENAMPVSTDVNLPRRHKARFPDKCVVCGCPSPGSTVRLMTGTIGWWTWLLWHFGRRFTVRAPACAACAWRLHLGRLASVLITIALCAIVFWLVWPLISVQLPHPARKWVMMGAALICLTPYFLYQVLFPHPFDITAHSDSVDYEFRDEDMAYEFADLNHDAEWVKIT